MKLTTHNSLLNTKAAATLPVILLVGGLIVEIGITGAFIAYFLSQSGFGIKLSEEALAAARAGIEDAKIRIVRDKNFNPSPNPYTLIVGSRSSQVTICKDICVGADKFQVDSLGIAFNKRRKIRAVIYVNSLTGEVKLESEREIAI
ncbi:hypothetical protein AUJ30_00560 [Candidatus Wolfebacteria bacterium CG1_02_39_135]|uniref:Uncharacterized protein n=3 Tax=Candidatus Wolfeibacteriota TaxID=1752735 RepID=A0A2M7Q6J0_9BACT|nr:hypothetical protein [Candidatus Wolfebacteria bacterium]OIO65728.1 MAG: hypothetical protein AUJ30_00560 [Candidatus Wolfebacteria bacterium CG1_02_39_135]PIY58993.1 MAG: hypothetical protein COY97_01245 [Candidatus Wolfebacteria bacterium CG_4_10_14_0_8_um_filter_39_64]